MSSDIPLKIFGCTCFVHIPNNFRSKLDPKSEKCIFLGYASNKKGYKYFNPVTEKTYISMDVIFMEIIPFFHKNQLQGEYGNGEDDFWQESEPLPKVVLTPSTPGVLDKKESEIVVENNKNEENHRQKTPEIILSNTGGGILQNTTAEPLVYSRKRFHKKKNV